MWSNFTFDAKKTIRGKFKPSPTAEREFFRSLKRIAQASGHIIERHTHGSKLVAEKEMQAALKAYSEVLTPWASRQAEKMLKTVQNSNERAYREKSKAIGLGLKLGLGEHGVDVVSRALLHEQVGLIKSIPIEAGLRAQRIAYEAVLAGTRAEVNEDTLAELQKQLGSSTEVAVNRAMLISRTETARATAAINQSRAMAVGSGQYRWHNSGDGAVRHSHRIYKGKKLQGMIFSWDHPPTLSDGMTGHPGTFPNCRCFAEPIFDAE